MADYNFLANPTQVDVMGSIGKGLTASSLMNQNLLFQARKQAGQDFLDSIKNGVPSQTDYLTNLQRSGAAVAPAALESAQQGQTLDQTTLDTRLKRLTALYARGAALIGQNPNGTSADKIHAEIDAAGTEFGLSPEEIAKAKSGFGPDPVANNRIMIRNAIGNLSAQDALLQSLGQTREASTGSGTEYPQVPSSAQQAAGVAAPSVTQGLSPDLATQRVKIIDNNRTLPNGDDNPNYGQPKEVSLQEWANLSGVKLPQAAITRGGTAAPAAVGTPRAPGAPGPTNQPRLPSAAPGSAAAPTAPPVAQPSNAQSPAPPGAASGLPPGAAIPIEAANTAWVGAQAGMGNFTNRTFPLVQAIALEPGVTTGPMSERFNAVKSFLVGMADRLKIDPAVVEGLKNNTADFEKLNKYLTFYTASLPQGAGTDARLAQAISGNPSVHLSNLGIRDVAKAAMALERFNLATAMDFQDKGAPNGQWLKYQADWQRTHDPRAFLVDLMQGPGDQAKIDTMVRKMTATERTAFLNTLQWSRNHPDVLNKPTMPGH